MTPRARPDCVGTASLDMSREDMEQLRLNLSRSSPLAEAVDRCLQQVDEHTLPAVVRTLATLARTGMPQQRLG
jgi:hypothetical protein